MEETRPLGKISYEVDEGSPAYVHPKTYRRQAAVGAERLEVGISGGGAVLLEELAAHLAEPFYLLYILHTPRGEGEPGRYQSPAVSRAEVAGFLHRFADYLGADARFDLWLHSPGSDATLIWDRHDLLFAYGPLDALSATLKEAGFEEGMVATAEFDHVHHYRDQFDADAAAVLTAFAWTRTSLRPEDRQ